MKLTRSASKVFSVAILSVTALAGIAALSHAAWADSPAKDTVVKHCRDIKGKICNKAASMKNSSKDTAKAADERAKDIKSKAKAATGKEALPDAKIPADAKTQ